jgi:hypothetical protein
MSAPTHASRLTKIVAAVAVVAALAFGANAISHSGGAATSTAQASQGAPGAGGRPGAMGTPVSGATLTRLKAVVLAKYPGTVERAVKLSDGSYVVHVVRSGGSEVHVTVSKDLAVTGTEQGPPGGGSPPAGQAAPS